LIQVQTELPAGWVVTTLGEVAIWGSGGTPKRTNLGYFGGSIPWLVIGDLNDGLVTQAKTHITELGLYGSAAKWVDAGAVLVAMYGSIGKLGIAGLRVTTNQAIAHAHAHEHLVGAKYLFWYLLSARGRLVSLGKGGSQQNISQTVLKAFPIPLAPRAAQDDIIAELEQQMTRLADGMSSISAARRRLADLRRSILLTSTRGCPRPTGRSGWQSLSLAEVADPARPICYGILKPRTSTPGTVPYVEVRDLRQAALRPEALNRTTEELDREYSRSRLRAGDVLVSIRGSYERIGIVPPELEGANISRDVARITPGDGVDSRYLLLWLRAPVAQDYFKSVARGVAVKGVNIGDLRRTRVDLPPIEEQQAIVQRAERQLSVVDELEAELDRSSARARALQRSILAAAFSGRLGAKGAVVG
jgi:type I restriction enzyme S subunit